MTIYYQCYMLEDPGDFEEIIQKRFGMVLIKPDAIDDDIFEYIIDYLINILHSKYKIELTGLFPVNITAEDIPQLYPDKDISILKMFEDYLATNTSIILCFKGDGDINIWEVLQQLRGDSIKNRSIEDLESGSNIGIEKGIRGLIPLPHKKDAYRSIFDTIVEYKGKGFIFEKERFDLYMRNLIHTPSSLPDFIGMTKLLNEEQLQLAFGYNFT